MKRRKLVLLSIACLAVASAAIAYSRLGALEFSDAFIDRYSRDTVAMVFPAGQRPSIDFVPGTRTMFETVLPLIRVYGVLDTEKQDSMIAGAQVSIRSADLPGVRVLFFSADTPRSELLRDVYVDPQK